MNVEVKRSWPKTLTVNFNKKDRSWNLLKRVFQEMEPYLSDDLGQENFISRYHLIDDEVEEGCRLILLCQIRPVLKVIFTKTYPMAWLESDEGKHYAGFIQEFWEKTKVTSKVQSQPVHSNLKMLEHASATIPYAGSSSAFVTVDIQALISSKVDTITHITAEENYVRIHMVDGTNTFARGPMKNWEKLLPIDRFVRLGRSLIINTTAVRRLHKVSRNLGLLTMAGNQEPISLGRKASYMLRDFFLKKNRIDEMK